MLKHEVGETIRKKREALRMDQDKLAKNAKTSRVTISSIETGASATNLDLLERIATALGCKSWELLKPADAQAATQDHDLAECARRVTEAALRDQVPAPAPASPDLRHLPPKILEYLAEITDPSDLALIEEDLHTYATEKIPQMEPAEPKESAQVLPKTAKKLSK